MQTWLYFSPARVSVCGSSVSGDDGQGRGSGQSDSVLKIYFIYGYTFLCRSELCSRYCGKNLTICKQKTKSKPKTKSSWGSGKVLCQAVAFFAARWFQTPPICFLSRQLPSMRLFLNRSTRYMFIEVVNPCLFWGTRFQDISDPFRCPEGSESPTP